MYYFQSGDSEGIFLDDLYYIKVSPSSGCYIKAKEDEKEGIVVNGNPYSLFEDAPMKDAPLCVVTEQSEWSDDIKELYNTKICNEAKVDKIKYLSEACQNAINAGSSIELADTTVETFSYNLNDQSNISEMANAVMLGADAYPYHANGESCKMYQSPDIITMYMTLSALKTHHLTYFNQLREYVNSLNDYETIINTQYGDELIGQYLEKYNTLMAEAQVEMNKVIATLNNRTVSNNE